MKVFSKIPPLSLLHICNPEIAKYVTEHLLQHGNDLDFVQDVLKATGSSDELNPILNSVLAGFGRRRRQGRFKCGQLNIHFDCLRFAKTTTEKDHDYKPKDIVTQAEEKAKATGSMSTCRYFQQLGGCRFGSRDCKFAHRCIICNMFGHGAVTCQARRQRSASATSNAGVNRRPPNPRHRRERAATTSS